jgi:hypothetical protein
MKAIHFFWAFMTKMIILALTLVIVCGCSFIVYKGNQPMSVAQAPKGMTYFEFIQDRLDAAKTVKPERCGTGMFASLAILGPFYSVLYTYVAIAPDSSLAKVTAPDPDILRDAKGVGMSQLPDIWWKTVERLSWTMLTKTNVGCKFRAINISMGQ